MAFLLVKISHLIFALFFPSLDYEITLDISIFLMEYPVPGESHSNTSVGMGNKMHHVTEAPEALLISFFPAVYGRTLWGN